MPNLGLLGITMKDESFFEAAQDGVAISIDFKSKTLDVDGRQFQFQLSQMERELFNHGGITSAFRNFGAKLFKVMTAPKGLGVVNQEVKGPHSELEW